MKFKTKRSSASSFLKLLGKPEIGQLLRQICNENTDETESLQKEAENKLEGNTHDSANKQVKR